MGAYGEPQTDSPRLASVRLIIGFLQGLVLYGLYRADQADVWPASEPMVFLPLGLVAFYVPLIAIQAAGSMRMRTLLIWAGLAAILLAGAGAYDRWRFAGGGHPRFALLFLTTTGIFITHALITAGGQARKLIAPYEDYFDVAWKLGVQLALALGFVGLFWGVLELGAALFNLIDLGFLSKLLSHIWFAVPATTLAMAAALHVTDVRAGLVAGIRTVALTLLSWLLPLMALLAAGFLVSLLVTGLDPLWKTRTAAALLLISAAALVILINAAWQNGRPEHIPAFVLRIGGSVAAIALVPLVALAAYALALRIGQHGWTEHRINAVACTVVAACYAIGYAVAAVRGTILRWHWLTGIAPVNIATSFVVLAIIFALLSPIADPVRISVASQVARLKSGAVPAAKFDYNYLSADGGRFGRAALKDLAANASGPDAALIRRKAKAALAPATRHTARKLPPGEIAGQIAVYPKGQVLPKSLLQQQWPLKNLYTIPPCLIASRSNCEAFPAELTGAPPDQYIFIWGGERNWRSAVLGQGGKGRWSVVGHLSGPHCKGVRKALRAGQYHVVAPTPPAFRAVEAGGSRFDVEPVKPMPSCP